MKNDNEKPIPTAYNMSFFFKAPPAKKPTGINNRIFMII
jgi:hypothetical protein